MMTIETVEISNGSLASVERALAAVGAAITAQYPTPGACGYLTITIEQRAGA